MAMKKTAEKDCCGMKMAKECCNDGTCGMHLCCKCVLPMLLFGILFLIEGFKIWPDAPVWFNGWTILGLFFAIWSVVGMMKK